MMSLGSVLASGVGGNSPSSTSNLSALALPFTVDRSNPKLNSNHPLLHYSDSSYGSGPYGKTWQYPHPSAPRLDESTDSTITPGMSLGYSNPAAMSAPSTNWSAFSHGAKTSANVFSYGGEVKPYYSIYVSPTADHDTPVVDALGYSNPVSISPPNTNWSALSPGSKTSVDVLSYGGKIDPCYSLYVSPMVDNGSPSVVDYGPCYDMWPISGRDVSSQIDYTVGLSDSEYVPQRDYSWGFGDGKQAKWVELDGSLSSKKVNVGGSLVCNNYVDQGVQSIECGDKYKEHLVVSNGKLNHVSRRESHIGSSFMGHMDDTSHLEQNLSFLPYESSRAPILMPGSAYPESRPLNLSFEGPSNFSDSQKLYTPFENSLQPLESSFSGSISVTRSSPAVVIRPPPAGNSFFAQNTACKTVDVDNIAGIHNAESNDGNCAKWNNPSLGENSVCEEASFDTSQFTSHKQGNDTIFFAPSPVKEMSSPLYTEDILDHNIKARFGSHLPDINVSNGSPLAINGVQLVKSAENSLDCLDNYTPAVDSPCWKGAPVSHFSPSDNAEGGKSPYSKEKMEECYDFDGDQLFFSFNDSARASSQKLLDGKQPDKNGYTRNSMPFSSKRTQDANCPNMDQCSTDAMKAGFDFASMKSSKGVEISNSLPKPTREFIPNNSGSGYDQKISDTKPSSGEENDVAFMKLALAGAVDAVMTFSDPSEGGAVAFRAAENVLCSPSSQEDTIVDAKVQRDPKLDAQTMIDAIRNLSELLLFYFSNDAFALEEHNYDALKHVISNIEACIAKNIVHRTMKQEPAIYLGDISGKLVDIHDMGTVAGKPQVTNEAVNSHVKLDYQQMHEGKRDHIFSGKGGESSSFPSSLRGDADISRDDHMGQAIMKVLDENFPYDEEMNSQALLFKNLWLEAEAKLCSISYKARFDRVNIEMEKLKSKREEANKAVREMSKSQVSPNPSMGSKLAHVYQDSANPKSSIQKISDPSTDHTDDIAASMMERFHILASRNDCSKSVDKEEQEVVYCEHGGTKNLGCAPADDVEAAIRARFHILKSWNDCSKSVKTEGEALREMANWESAGMKKLGCGNADDIKASTMDSFHILKSRNNSSKSLHKEEEEVVDCEFGGKINPGCDPTDGIEAAVRARFHILKSRNDCSKSVKTEEEALGVMINRVHGSTEKLGHENADDAMASIMDTFHILKSRNNSSKSVNTKEAELPEMVDCKCEGTKNLGHGHADDTEASVMDRFHILKSRNDNSKLIHMENEPAQMVDSEYTGKENLWPSIVNQSEDESSNLGVNPVHLSGSLSESKFGSHVDAAGYASVKEFRLSVTKDPVVHSFGNDRLRKQPSSGWYDNSSLDWEHVLKDDYAWKH